MSSTRIPALTVVALLGLGVFGLRLITDPETLDDVLRSDRAILYKHSTRCPVSAVVIDEVLRFARAHPDWRVYVLKVIEQRALSNTVAERLGVRHQSPQAFVIRQGHCVWNAAHADITAERLAACGERPASHRHPS